MAMKFDVTLKTLVEKYARDFAATFGLPTDEPVTLLNVDLSTMSAATDSAFGFGKPLREIADVNFQSGPDANLPSRLLVYSALLHARHRVPVRTLAILLRRKADHSSFTEKYAYAVGGRGVEFSYDIVRMWEQPVEAFLAGSLGSLPLAMLCKLPGDQSTVTALREVIREIDKRLGREATEAEAAWIRQASFHLAFLRLKGPEVRAIFEGVPNMEDTDEMTAYDELLEEGQLRGIQLTLLRQCRNRFGPTDLDTEAELRSIQDSDRLGRLSDAIFTANSWEELLATP